MNIPGNHTPGPEQSFDAGPLAPSRHIRGLPAAEGRGPQAPERMATSPPAGVLGLDRHKVAGALELPSCMQCLVGINSIVLS